MSGTLKSLGPALMTALLLAACGGGDESDGTSASSQDKLAEGSGVSVLRASSVQIGVGPTVIINEVMASNFFGATDEDGDVEDWVELYNPTAATVNLSGWGLSNKPASPFRWVFPSGAALASKAYLRVWLSKKDRTTSSTSPHTNFNLDNGADELVLSAPNQTLTGITIDKVTLPLMRKDVSLCRMPSGVPGAPLAHCLKPTPRAANSGTAHPSMLAKPTISLPSGVYGAAQTVSMAGPQGAQIRYTLDGSEPTATSALYSAPLAVSASGVLRAAAFQTGAVPSQVETASYVIDVARRFAGQRALFLTMSPSDMSNYKAGGRPSKGWPAHVAMTAQGSGALLFSADTQGSDSGQLGSRQGQSNIPLDIKFKDALGTKDISAAIFSTKPGVAKFKRLKLRNSGDDYWYAHLRDGYWQSLLNEKLAPGAAQEPVQVFTNGQYYGMMDLREKEDETLVEATYGVDKDFVQYFSDSKVLGGFNAQADYATMRNHVLHTSMEVPANYETARRLLDVENFAHDFALHMFAANRDWLWRNMHYFRMPGYDGRWRFRPHDFDISSGGRNSWGYDTAVNRNMNDVYGYYDAGRMMSALLLNPEFRNLYINVIADQLNSTLSAPALTARLERMVADMAPYMQTHWELLPSSRGASYAQWQSSITQMRDFLSQREGFYDAHTRAKFGLSARKTLKVSVNDSTMGTVKVNTLSLSDKLSAAEPVWTGRYYPEVPVTLEARPEPGYVFVGWQGGSSASSSAISASVATDGVEYRAVFVSAGNVPAPSVGTLPAQVFLTGDTVLLDVPASDPTGHRLTWSAKKLPSGLDIHPDTGRIFGKPTKGGSFASTITVSNGKTSSTTNLAWSINHRGDRIAVLPQDVVGDGDGLSASFFGNAALTGTPALTRTELPALALGSGAAPVSGFGTSLWSVRWDGFLQSPVAGLHTLRAMVRSDDGVRVYVGGTLVIDNWSTPSTTARQTGAITLPANTKLPVRVEFMDASGSASLQMQWQLPGATVFNNMPLGVFSTAQ